MEVVLATGGFTNGGLNFDAKRRRESWRPSEGEEPEACSSLPAGNGSTRRQG